MIHEFHELGRILEDFRKETNREPQKKTNKASKFFVYFVYFVVKVVLVKFAKFVDKPYD